ncbi:hypothetical protein BGZ96_009483 [Linnemannia gamsii]|uniref:F-box domain-containing protein n=1 Tax=Linnemannia gamsii TaxID=64522 RepID=A0ABQ7JW37_9FUNG|nr:hypothetical protein BGZ96_009483 [Linnemannia gamsii]
MSREKLHRMLLSCPPITSLFLKHSPWLSPSSQPIPTTTATKTFIFSDDILTLPSWTNCEWPKELRRQLIEYLGSDEFDQIYQSNPFRSEIVTSYFESKPKKLALYRYYLFKFNQEANWCLSHPILEQLQSFTIMYMSTIKDYIRVINRFRSLEKIRFDMSNWFEGSLSSNDDKDYSRNDNDTKGTHNEKVIQDMFQFVQEHTRPLPGRLKTVICLDSDGTDCGMFEWAVQKKQDLDRLDRSITTSDSTLRPDGQGRALVQQKETPGTHTLVPIESVTVIERYIAIEDINDIAIAFKQYNCDEIVAYPPFVQLNHIEHLHLDGWTALTFDPSTLLSTTKLRHLSISVHATNVNDMDDYYFENFIPPVDELCRSYGIKTGQLAAVAEMDLAPPEVIRPRWTWDWNLPLLSSLQLTAEFALLFEFRMLLGCPSLGWLYLVIRSIRDRRDVWDVSAQPCTPVPSQTRTISETDLSMPPSSATATAVKEICMYSWLMPKLDCLLQYFKTAAAPNDTTNTSTESVSRPGVRFEIMDPTSHKQRKQLGIFVAKDRSQHRDYDCGDGEDDDETVAGLSINSKI